MNDSGWVAGWLGNSYDGDAVLWRDTGPPLDLGVRGSPVDINEGGDVVVQNYEGRWAAAFTWRDGTLRRLPGTRSHPAVYVTAINDNGVVVGSVSGRRGNARAAIWRNRKLRVLAPPPGAPAGSYFGQDINNNGLMLGWAGAAPDPYPWWRAGGRSGAMSTDAGRIARGFATHVDDRGRVVGFVAPRGEDYPRGPTIKWRSVHSAPNNFLKRGFQVNGVHPDSGYVVGSTGQAFLTHLSKTRATLLPDPPTLGEGLPVDSTEAFDVATGQNAYAPNGGVSVVGTAHFGSLNSEMSDRAVIWTCAPHNR